MTSSKIQTAILQNPEKDASFLH